MFVLASCIANSEYWAEVLKIKIGFSEMTQSAASLEQRKLMLLWLINHRVFGA